MCCEFFPDGHGNRRSVVREAVESGLQRPLARRAELAANRIIVLQIERA